MLQVYDMQSDRQDTSVHAVSSSIVFDRIKSGELSDEISKVKMKDIHLRIY